MVTSLSYLSATGLRLKLGIGLLVLVSVSCPLTRVVIAGTKSAVADVAGDPLTPPVYKDFLKCGPNALYLFLAALGHTEISLDQCEALPVSSYGTSLLDIRNACCEFKVPAEIRQYSVNEIDLVPLPAIGQFRARGSSSATKYHFNLIYKRDWRRIYIIDGTTGRTRSILRPFLARTWTGIAMSQPLKGAFSFEGLLSLLDSPAIIPIVMLLLIFHQRRLQAWQRLSSKQDRKGAPGI